jgi:transglutaminase-like putative cysteine protease
VRSIFLILFLAVAYTLLRGWPEDAAPLVRGIAAVLVLTVGLGLWARRFRPPVALAASRRRARVVDFMTMAAFIMAMNCLFLLFISTAPEPAAQVAYRLHASLAPEGRVATRHRAASATAAEATTNNNWLWDQDTRRDLPRRANFKPGNKPEVFVKLENPAEAAALVAARPYVRAFSFGDYRDSGWSQVAGPPVELAAGSDGLVHLAKIPGRGIRHKIYHRYDRSGRNPFTALQGAESARLPALTQLAEGLYILPPPLTDPDGYEYSAVSKPMRIDDLSDSIEVQIGPNISTALLALPGDPGLRQAISRLALLQAGSGSLVERLRRMQNFLRTSLSYSLEISNPNNRDPLENFLFHEKRGHCELYATAGALLARAIGIPSRIAYGWAGGTYLEAQNLFVFRAYEAHAWAEVWLEPYGWVVLDPTPPAAIARPPADLAEINKPTPLPDPAEFLDSRPDPAALSQQPGRAALIFSGIFLPSAALLLLMRSRRTRHERSHHGPRETAKPPGYLQAFRTASARHGLPLPPSRTLRQHFAHLESLGQTPRFAPAMLDYHYRTRYDGSTPDPGEEGMLLREIRTWSHAAVASRASKGGRR